MNWKLLFLGVIVTILLFFLAVVVGGYFFVTDDSPLLYYDARPATVEEPALTETGYTSLNSTSFNVSYRPIPGFGRNVSMRVWASTYVSGISTAGAPTEPAAGTATEQPGAGNVSIDVANTSVVTAFSMSSLELGPVAFNPLVYASDPGVLDQSGFFIDQGESYLPANVTNVTDLSVQSDRPVTMLGQDTQMTRLSGSLVVSPDAEPVNVTVYVARVTHEGNLVMMVGVAPVSGDVSDEFVTLAGSIRHWEADEGNPPQFNGTGTQARLTAGPA